MEKPKVPADLVSVLAENTGMLKFFSELSPERQRRFIDLAAETSSIAELRSMVRKMSGR